MEETVVGTDRTGISTSRSTAFSQEKRRRLGGSFGQCSSTPKGGYFHFDVTSPTSHSSQERRTRFRSDIERQSLNIDSCISQFHQTKKSLLQTFVPVQTSELKRRGHNLSFHAQVPENDGDSSADRAELKPDDVVDEFKHSFLMIESKIQKERAKNEIKRDEGNKRSKDYRKAKLILREFADFEDGCVKIDLRTARALGDSADSLTWHESMEILNEKFGNKLRSRATRVRFAYFAAYALKRGEKACGVLRTKLRKIFRKITEGIKRIPVRPPVPVQGVPSLNNSRFVSVVLATFFYIDQLNNFLRLPPRHEDAKLGAAFKQFCRAFQKGGDMTSFLSEIIECLPEFGDGSLHCAHDFILKFLERLDCDMRCSSPLSKEFLSSLFSSRFFAFQKNKCKELHSMFSTLVETVYTCSKCFETRQDFEYARTLGVPVMERASVGKDNVVCFGPDEFYSETITARYRKSGQTAAKAYAAALRDWHSRPRADQLPAKPQPSSFDFCLKYLMRTALQTNGSESMCQHCRKSAPHFKQAFLRHTSKVLVVHLQRLSSESRQKVETFVECPEELDMQQYYQGGRRYELRSVINLHGSLAEGHYSAYVKARGQWYSFSDNNLSVVSPGMYLFHSAYVLTYIMK